MVLENRLADRRRALLAIAAKRVASFKQAPPIIFAATDDHRRFPQILTILTDPQQSGFAIKRHSPRIAEAIRPYFRPGIGEIQEGVVLGHRIIFATLGMID